MDKNINPCSCPIAGFCLRHEGTIVENKTKPMYSLCQSSEKYRKMWDNLPKNQYDYPNSQVYNLEGFSKEEVDDLNRIKNNRNPQSDYPIEVDMAGLKEARLKEENKNIEKKKAKEAKKRSQGLGDTIEKGLSMFGITSERIEKITGKKCGCGKRRDKLNKLFPYSNAEPEEIVEEVIESHRVSEVSEQTEINPSE